MFHPHRSHSLSEMVTSTTSRSSERSSASSSAGREKDVLIACNDTIIPFVSSAVFHIQATF